ncbi:MAG: hypothetical protein Q8P59_08885, partial [Dehalococcoidia bacterium]|nr:hypothetical protein [Dehalococcoidia bacterium]
MEGRERDEMALARVFGLQRVAAGRAPAFAKIRFLEHPITRGFPLISEEPHLDLIVPLDLKAFRRGQEYTTRYTADGGTALARARPLDDERAGEDLGFDYIALGQYGSGHTLWFHEGPGFSLFLRYAIATRKGSDGGRTIPTGTSLEADDLEPVIWRIVNNFLRQLDIPMVSLGVSPSRYSFSVAHDTEDLSCLKAAVRIKELDDTCGIEGTWYLRTQVEEGQYPHHPFYYEQKPYSLEEAARCLGEASVGLHGEGYTWISENLSPSLEPGETYSAARSAIRAAFPGAQVRSGSTHLGNYVEKYPQEYEALRDAGFRLWRNSYKFNGLTAMRPYAFYRPDGKAIHGIWGYCDAFTDDIAGADFERGNSVGHPGEVIRQKWEKAIRWLAVVGEGNLFL